MGIFTVQILIAIFHKVIKFSGKKKENIFEYNFEIEIAIFHKEIKFCDKKKRRK
jgi:hypothetical protein